LVEGAVRHLHPRREGPEGPERPLGRLCEGRQDQRHPHLHHQRQALRKGRDAAGRDGSGHRRGRGAGEGPFVSHRRTVLIAALAFGLTAAAAPAAEDGMARGNPKAKVTVVEYASVGCPHCGNWARNVWPEFRARYVDTGKVRFVLREAITGDAELATAGFLTARCAGPAKYFQVVD